jgi:hypothetical protein
VRKRGRAIVLERTDLKDSRLLGFRQRATPLCINALCPARNGAPIAATLNYRYSRDAPQRPTLAGRAGADLGSDVTFAFGQTSGVNLRYSDVCTGRCK